MLSRTSASAAAASAQPRTRASLPSSVVAATVKTSSSRRRRGDDHRDRCNAVLAAGFDRQRQHAVVANAVCRRVFRPVLFDLQNANRTAGDDDARIGGHVPEQEGIERVAIGRFGGGTKPQSNGNVTPSGSGGRDTDITSHRGSYFSLMSSRAALRRPRERRHRWQTSEWRRDPWTPVSRPRSGARRSRLCTTDRTCAVHRRPGRTRLRVWTRIRA